VFCIFRTQTPILVIDIAGQCRSVTRCRPDHVTVVLTSNWTDFYTTTRMRHKAPYSAARGLIRMSWNKYNLYNLVKCELPPPSARKTLFQQRWYAKRMTRAYHGDRITERRWQALFDRHGRWLPTGHSVGEDMSGLSNILRQTPGFGGAADATRSSIPPMNQRSTLASLTYAALERRLDIAVFRCLFAPSVYAAKQMVRHGKVKVNGKKQDQPSYSLQDGDIITVDPQAIQMLSGEPGTVLKYTPKPYSQPFHFLPDYLEVDYATCSAVFLRSPVARPGRSEIPSPFPPEMHQLAYEFYVRKRGKAK
jgi:ribosomal protein S4